MLTKAILNNTAFLTASTLLSKIAAYAYFIIIVRRFSQEEIGLYAVLITAYLFMELFSNLGLDKIVIRELSRARDAHDHRLIHTALGIKAGVSLCVLILCVGLFSFFYADYFYLYPVQICLFFTAVFPLAVSRTIESYFTAHERMAIPAISQFAERGTLLAAAGLVAAGVLQFRGFLLAPLAATGVRMLLLLACFPRRGSVLAGLLPAGGMMKLLKESFKMLTVEVFALIYFRFDIFMLSKMADMRVTGIYQVAYKVFDFFISLFAGYLTAVFPWLSRRKEHAGMAGILLYGALLLLGISCGVILFREPLLACFQKEYTQGATALLLLMLTLPLVYVTSMLANYAIALNRAGLLMKLAPVLVLCNVCLNYFLIPRFSINGAALATLGCEVLSAAVLLWSLRTCLMRSDTPAARA